MDNSYKFTWHNVTVFVWGVIIAFGAFSGAIIDPEFGIIVSISVGSAIICGMLFLLWQRLTDILEKLRNSNV